MKDQLSLFTLLSKVGEGRPVRPASENLNAVRVQVESSTSIKTIGVTGEVKRVDEARECNGNVGENRRPLGGIQNTLSELGSGIRAGESRTDTPQPKTKDICAKYHKSNPFSVAAGQKAAKGAEKAKTKILDVLSRSKNGLICEQIEDFTDLSHQSCSARLSELKRDRKVYTDGSRETTSGSRAAVYKVKP